MIIWGFGGSKLNDRGAVWPAMCPNCHNNVLLHHVTTHATFSLFFIPLIPYDRKHHLMCPICRKSIQFDKSELPRIEAGKQLLVRARLGQIGETEYMSELEQLRSGVPAALPSPAGPPAAAGYAIPGGSTATGAGPGPSGPDVATRSDGGFGPGF
jgi:hypothetical protein